jgi:hypothetical protein
MLMPHSIIHGDAHFAYFNKIWGIPISCQPELFRFKPFHFPSCAACRTSQGSTDSYFGVFLRLR